VQAVSDDAEAVKEKPMGRCSSVMLLGAMLFAVVLFAVVQGCGSQSPDAAIRSRWNQFMQGVLSDDLDSSRKVLEPDYLKEQGDEAINQRLKGFGEILRAGKIKMEDLRIDQVSVAEGEKSATVDHSMRTQEGKWLAQAGYGHWVKVGSTWYITWR
jgi:hypothetical protein